MERGFHPRAHPSAFHDYVRGVFADRCAQTLRLHEARALWLRRLARRTASSPAVQRWEGEGGSIR